MWRAVDDGRVQLELDTMLDTREGAAALRIWQRNASAWAHQIVEDAYGLERTKGFRAITEQPLRLTRQEAKALAERLDEVLRAALKEKRDPADGERTTYLYFSIMQPHPQRTGI